MNESENENENESENENDNDNDDTLKKSFDCLDEIINKTKSFAGQIKLFKKVKNIGEYYWSDHNDEELEFKVRLAHLSNIIDEELFVKIFGYIPEALANKLINTTNKEENQIIVNDI